jgi:hypothetical protein
MGYPPSASERGQENFISDDAFVFLRYDEELLFCDKVRSSEVVFSSEEPG